MRLKRAIILQTLCIIKLLRSVNVRKSHPHFAVSLKLFTLKTPLFAAHAVLALQMPRLFFFFLMRLHRAKREWKPFSPISLAANLKFTFAKLHRDGYFHLMKVATLAWAAVTIRETPFHFGWINNRNTENVGRAHRFPLVIFSRPWVTDTRPINASGDAWQNRAIAFINTNGGSPRARRGVLQWGCVPRWEGWFAAAMVAAAWLRFSAIDRTDALRVRVRIRIRMYTDALRACPCGYMCVRVYVLVRMCMRVRVWNETRARKTVRGKKMLEESAAVGARVGTAFVSSTLRFVGFSRLGDALSNLSAD